ncbi:MAG TPA: ABC transporter permease [Kofleriaceae bacterium]|nr:ABC transporter permease [Kofleriaceae bacterium]
MEAKLDPPRSPGRPQKDRDPAVLRGWIDLAVGLALIAIGAIILTASFDLARSRVTHVATYIPIGVGALTAVRGIWRLLRSAGGIRLSYKSFVAWRYLLVARVKVSRRVQWMLLAGFTAQLVGALLLLGFIDAGNPRLALALWILAGVSFLFNALVVFIGVLRHSKPALIIGIIGIVLLGLSLLLLRLVGRGTVPLFHLEPETALDVLRVASGTAILGAVLVLLAMLFGTLRAFFTFFTTVPIGGVWIGTAALVAVLSVMSGFETDLRDKILGSNAHLQITREDGDFTEWREIKAKIDRMPGVIASSPYATSEVVIAANNTPMNVVIKGIDPANIGKVSDLVNDLEDREAVKRLEPIVADPHDLRVPQTPRPSGSEVIDPPPADMPSSGDPIDFSRPSSANSDGSAFDAAADHGAAHPADRAADRAADQAADHAADHAIEHPGEVEPPEPFGGDAGKLIDAATVDPAPSDLLTTDEPPADYSRPDYAPDSVVKVIDVPFDSPSLSRRTQSLPGILVGRELVKQTHLYTGEEVRVVSPLSDPANPDANGTPIPFNRDYRVAGIFFTGMYEYDLKFVYVTLQSLQDFLDRGDAIDGIEVRVTNPDDTDAYVAKLHNDFGPHYRIQDWKELNRSLFSALKLEKIAMFLVLGIVILVASFSIIGDLIMVVVEKQREIALLKTLGASDVGVMQLFAVQGLMIGLIGTAIGIATGLLLCWAGKRFGVPVSPDVYYIDRLPIHVEPTSVIAAASAGILISIAATLYPALVAARVRPAAGMRH